LFAYGSGRLRKQDAVSSARLTVEIGADFAIGINRTDLMNHSSVSVFDVPQVIDEIEPVAPMGQRRLELRPGFLELGQYECWYSE
jgi:hypothetical protein